MFDYKEKYKGNKFAMGGFEKDPLLNEKDKKWYRKKYGKEKLKGFKTKGIS